MKRFNRLERAMKAAGLDYAVYGGLIRRGKEYFPVWCVRMVPLTQHIIDVMHEYNITVLDYYTHFILIIEHPIIPKGV